MEWTLEHTTFNGLGTHMEVFSGTKVDALLKVLGYCKALEDPQGGEVVGLRSSKNPNGPYIFHMVYVTLNDLNEWL
jgi:hypothetical protein